MYGPRFVCSAVAGWWARRITSSGPTLLVSGFKNRAHTRACLVGEREFFGCHIGRLIFGHE